MASREHLALLKKGVDGWNRWRERIQISPDLERADLSKTNLSGANLSGSYLTEAKLFQANLIGAYIARAHMPGADLRGAELRDANLSRANMERVDLFRANLGNAKLAGASLRGANLSVINLLRADLSEANLGEVDLRSANLQYARFDKAVLTGCKLWETQRAGWSIKDVICDRVYWDEHAQIPIEYAPGEFERLYSAQTCIELFYQDGISTFEMSTLPALLQHLASRHPDANIRLKTIEETGGGVKITISLGDAAPEIARDIQEDAARAHQLQLTLRGRENELIDLKAALRATERAYDKLLDKLSDSKKQEITILGNLQGPLQLGDHASADFRAAVFNDNTALIQLIDKLLTHRAELSLSPAEGQALTENAEAVKSELQKKNPNKSILKRSLEFFATLPKEAILKGVGKLGEKATEADWPSLVHQLDEFIHHLH